MKNKILLILIGVFFWGIAFAQSDLSIQLKSGAIKSTELIKPTDDLKEKLSANQFRNNYFTILQFDHHLSDTEKEKLKQQGIELQEYIPSFAYIAKVSNSSNLATTSVKGILAFQAEFKYSLELAKGKIPTHALNGNQVRLNVMKFDGISTADFQANLRSKDIEISMLTERLGLVEIALDKLASLANLPTVKYIEPVHPTPEKEGLRGRTVQRVNMLSSGPGDGFDGTGVMVGLADDGGVSHVDFKGRLTDFTANQGGTHGDMTAGLAVGAGNINPLGMGMATDADINLYDYQSSFNNPPVTSAVNNFNTYGQVISSTSYSESSGATYTERSNFVDNQVFNNTQLLHFYSAGNSASSNSSPVYGGIVASNGGYFGNVTGGSKAAKNTIAVANLFYNDARVTSSSRGPTADGRIKPDISAHGQGNLSLDPNNQYGPGGGTSAAAPSTAGTVAMLYDAYRTLNGGANPNGALLKAAILNSADDVGRAGPDYEYGWGRIHAGNAYNILANNQYLFSTITNNASNTHNVAVPAGAKEVKVMVLWIDPAAAANAAVALVNDINIKMTTPGGQDYNPWILGTAANLASLEANAVRGIDNRNNMEQVSLENPAAGNYTITVDGFNIPQGPQEYVLVYHFTMDDIRVSYPNGGESVVPGIEESIRWDAAGNQGTFTLEYSTNNGASWTNIASNVAASQRYYDWTPPSNLSGNALIRVSRNGISDVSDASFYLLGEPNFSIVGGTNNDAVISWSSVAGANGYDIFKLGAKHMEVIGSTSSTSFTLTNLVLGQSDWYSVRAKNSSTGTIGRRAYAKEYLYVPCDVNITISVTTDQYPQETSWDIKDANGVVFASSSGYSQASTTFNEVVCLPFGCYDFTIYDSYGDGICCQFGNGSYSVTDNNGNVVASGGQFTNSEVTNFCLQNNAALSLTTSATPVSCFGGDDGSATVTATGGSGNYTYTWSNGGATATINSLIAGTYSVTVNDGNSTETGSVVVQDGTPITYYADTDNDGFGDANNTTQGGCTAPAGYVTDNTDCDDTNASVYPNAPELCDGLDNNCNGQTDEGVQNTYYADADNDGFGDANNTTQACSVPAGYVTDNTDCDDTNASVYPNAPEVCDGVDNNCNGQVDENGSTTYYADADGDGFGDANNSIQGCNAPTGYVTDNTDCDDTNSSVYPNAPELCDGLDNNCNGQTDEGVQNTYYADADNDGFGDANNTTQACSAPAGYVTDNTDCDDTNSAIYPNAPELCDGLDNNCNGQTDEGVQNTYYADTDGDGFGDANNTTQACTAPTGYVTDNTDCDDTNANIYIGATCDDNDPNTTGDVINANCICEGVPVTGCTENEVSLTLNLDNYPQETTWELTNSAGTVLHSGGTYSGQQGITINEVFCLPNDCYTFTINDSFGDGICCGYGNGSYTLTNANGTVLASGGDFGSTESTDFCFGALVYCGSQGNNQNYEYIESVAIGTINNISGNSNGYADFTNLSTTVSEGETVNVTLTPGFANTAYAENWRIWIDYNQDGDFEDAGEEVFAPAASNAAISGNFTISASANAGATRMRVSMKWNGAPTPCESFTYGEVEDYTIVISSGNAARNDQATTRSETFDVGTVGEPLTFSFDERATWSMNLYPNPVRDILTVEVTGIANAPSQITILTLDGKTVFNKAKVGTFENVLKEDIQVNDLPAGMYFLKIVTGDDILTQRFSKLR